MAKYIGLTIGPIVKTLQTVRGPRQLWGSSYIFSYIMKNIIKKLEDDNKNRNFIIPYIANKEILELKIGAGLFPDRLIFESFEDDFKYLKKVVDEVLKNLSTDIAKTLHKDSEKSDIENYINDYFKIYYIEVDLDKNSNIIEIINPYLDALELREKFVLKVKNDFDYLYEYFKKENIERSILVEDAFGRKNALGSTQLQKIATAEFSQYKIDTDEEKYYEKLKEEIKNDKKCLKKPHKYIAIVQADGDFMGELIKNLKDIKDYNEFSSTLMNFGVNAVEIIKNNNGMPIYAGGDDLLFIAPVINGSKNIFSLVDEISECFNSTFNQLSIRLNVKPSTSFGVSIVYYKYPLYESFEQALTELFENAKNYKLHVGKDEEGNDIINEKNAIAYRVLKHSGQYFYNIFNKESKTYEKFKMLIQSIENDKDFLKALHYRLFQDKQLLISIMRENETFENMIKNYFNNSFNENIHKSSKIYEYLENVKELIVAIYNESSKEEIQNIIDNVYSYLKFVRFLNEGSGEDE